MNITNRTSFDVCDDAIVGDSAIQGFYPCPWPYSGVGTYENPELGCSVRGMHRDAGVQGSLILMVLFIFSNTVVFFKSAKRLYFKHKNKEKIGVFDKLMFINMCQCFFCALYSIDPDGRKGWMQFGVSNFFLHSSLFCIQLCLYEFTNMVITNCMSMKYHGKEPPHWLKAKRFCQLQSFYWNLINPFLEISLVPEDSLQTPFFGAGGPFHYAGWNGTKLRALRFIALICLLNGYSIACAMSLSKLMKQLTGGQGKDEKTMALVKKLRRQQRSSMILCIFAGLFFAVNIPAGFSDYNYRVTTVPCSLIGGLLDIPLFILSLAGVIVYYIMRPAKKTKKVNPETASTVVSASSSSS